MIASEAQARDFVVRLGDSAALERIDRLIGLLLQENERQNLVAKPTLPAIWQRHIADSAQLLGHIPENMPGIWLDLGTGAGFPGLVIAALRPEWDVRLVESRRKRAEWLESTRIAMGLARCSVIGSRLEAAKSFAASVISARAFAPLPRLLELSARFSTSDTIWLLPKGRSAAQELASLPESQRGMFHVEHSQTDPEAGIIVGRLEQEARRRA